MAQAASNFPFCSELLGVTETELRHLSQLSKEFLVKAQQLTGVQQSLLTSQFVFPFIHKSLTTVASLVLLVRAIKHGQNTGGRVTAPLLSSGVTLHSHLLP